MITHIVFLQAKDVSDVSFIVNELLSMKGKMEYVRHLEVGTDISNEARSMHIALTVKFRNVDDLKKYATDPFHLEVLNAIRPKLEFTKIVDYLI